MDKKKNPFTIMTKRLRNKNTFNKKDTGLKENSQILLKI